MVAFFISHSAKSAIQYMVLCPHLCQVKFSPERHRIELIGKTHRNRFPYKFPLFPPSHTTPYSIYTMRSYLVRAFGIRKCLKIAADDVKNNDFCFLFYSTKKKKRNTNGFKVVTTTHRQCDRGSRSTASTMDLMAGAVARGNIKRDRGARSLLKGHLYGIYSVSIFGLTKWTLLHFPQRNFKFQFVC